MSAIPAPSGAQAGRDGATEVDPKVKNDRKVKYDPYNLLRKKRGAWF